MHDAQAVTPPQPRALLGQLQRGRQFILTELAQHGSVLKVVEELRDQEKQFTMSHKLEIMLQVLFL